MIKEDFFLCFSCIFDLLNTLGSILHGWTKKKKKKKKKKTDRHNPEKTEKETYNK